MEKLALFFNAIKDLSFWQRIFSWKKIRSLSFDAYEEYRQLSRMQEELQQKNQDHGNKLIKIETENNELLKRTQQNETENRVAQEKLRQAENRVSELGIELNKLKLEVQDARSKKEQQDREFDKRVGQLDQLKENLEKARQRLDEDERKKIAEEFEAKKLSWANHESAVEQSIRTICHNQIIKYVDEVPFKGSPDNTIEICGEYIIFDAKSPAGDDLENFPKYIKAQTESVKKYANQENVKKDIFLVIPSNTVDVISQFSYNMGDYTVYIVTLDALEPIILSLKKIEDYEFAEQLSPEERDNICRIIGKFAHTTKRKIQIDQFFTAEFLDLLNKCRNDLPEEILKQVIEFEKAEKLNPPSEKRSKQILTKDLQEKNNLLSAEAKVKNIDIPETFDEIKNLE